MMLVHTRKTVRRSPQHFTPIITAILVILLLSLPQTTSALLTNRTIDDTVGDVITLFRPIYRPSTLGVWEGNTCGTCSILPVRESAFDGTWTAATYNPELESISIELSFTGVAIYVYFILANFQGDGITTKTVCDFILDGQRAESFTHEPTDSPLLDYDSLVFSRLDLTNTTHNLTIETTGIRDEHIYVNFDYAMYTFDDGVDSSSSTASNPGPTSQSTSNGTNKLSPAVIGGIVAAIVGTLVVIAIAALIWFCHRRRQKHLQPRPLSAIDESPVMVTFPSHGAALAPITPFTGHIRDTGSNAYSGTPENQMKKFANTQHGNSQMELIPNRPKLGLAGGGPGYGNNLVPYQRTHDVFSSLPTGEVLLAPKRRSTFGEMNQEGTSTTQTAHQTVFTPRRSLSTANATPEELRRARQEELNQQMATIKKEMDELAGRKSTIKRPRANHEVEDAETLALREQIRALREHVQFLQGQQQSPWAQGLSDELPPRYTPAPSLAHLDRTLLKTR